MFIADQLKWFERHIHIIHQILTQIENNSQNFFPVMFMILGTAKTSRMADPFEEMDQL